MWQAGAQRLGEVVGAVALLSGGFTIRGAAQLPAHVRHDVPIARHAAEPAATSRVLLDIRISDDLHTGIMGRVTSGGNAYLPLQRVLTFVGIHSRVSGITLSASGDAARPGFRLDGAARTLRIGRSEVSVSESSVLTDGTTLYASMPLLERLILVAFDVDLANATVQIRSADALPVLRRQTALSAAARSSAVVAFLDPVPVLASRAHGMLQTDYNLSLGLTTPTAPTLGSSGAATSLLFSARFAARMLGGSLTGSVTTGSTSSSLSDVRWTQVRPQSSLIKRIVIGDLDSRAAVSERNRGISFDNYPIDLSERRLIRVRGRAEPGWSYTVSDGANWIGSERPDDALYEFLLPIVGDARRVDIVAWGPNGQERRIARSVRALPVRVQRGEFQYAAAAGRCGRDGNTTLLIDRPVRPCGFAASADGVYGLTDWLAARTGVDLAHGAATPYLGGAIVLGQSLELQGTAAVGARGRSAQSWSAQYDPSPAITLGFSRNITIDNRRSDFASARVAPVRWNGRASLDGYLSTVSGAASPTRIGHVGVTSAFGNSRLEIFGSRTISDVALATPSGPAAAVDGLGLFAQTAPTWMRLPTSRRTSLSGTIERTSNGNTRSALQLAVTGARGSIELVRQFAARSEAGRWSILFSPRSTRVRQRLSVARSDAAPGVASAGNSLLSFAGGANWDMESRRLELTAQQSTGRGGITGIAFLDLNENGERDAAEPVIPDIPLVVGNQGMRTDSSGRFRVANITATELIEISVDSMALPSPCWRPASPRWRVRSIDGGTSSVLLPVRRGGVLEGRVLRVQRTVGTFRTELSPWTDPPHLTAVSTTTGKLYALEVFGSGSFYVLGLPFDTYDISMQESDQRQNNITLAPTRVVVASGAITQNADGENDMSCPSTVAIIRTTPRDAGALIKPQPHLSVATHDHIATTNMSAAPTTAVRSDFVADAPSAAAPATERASTRGTARRIGDAAASRAKSRAGSSARRRRKAGTLHRGPRRHSAAPPARPRTLHRGNGGDPKSCVLPTPGQLFVTSPLWSLHYCRTGQPWKP